MFLHQMDILTLNDSSVMFEAKIFENPKLIKKSQSF